MKIKLSKIFKKKYKKLPDDIKEATRKQLRRLIENPRHPSLNMKKMQDPRNIWEARINFSYRFTFQIDNKVFILRNIGTHDILNKP